MSMSERLEVVLSPCEVEPECRRKHWSISLADVDQAEALAGPLEVLSGCVAGLGLSACVEAGDESPALVVVVVLPLCRRARWAPAVFLLA